MIRVRDFGFRYRGSEECAVRDVNLDIPEGSFVGVTGAAASGKSTLTYALNGIIPHCYSGDFYGSVVIDGVDTVEASLTEISRLVGSVCQDIESQIVTPLVEDEILYGLENFGVARDEGIARMEDVLGAMGIEELRSCEISSLSGGQKQKVAIASILALRPCVLVLDEPTAELDPAASRSVFDLLKQYSREHKITVVAVEQKIALLCDYADMVVVMEEGSVRVSGTPDEVLVHAPELYAMGVNVPRVTSLTRSLRDKGVYAGPVCRTASQAALHIAQSLREKGRAIPLDAAPSGSFAECVASCEKEAGKGEGRTRRNEKAGLAALEFHDVYAGYEGELAVLKGVDFAIQEGEFVAFVGANGAGKSTTMRLMNGLIKPSAGKVSVFGTSTASCPTSELARTVGFLFQNPDRQICKTTVREELLFGFEATGRVDARAQRAVDEAIEEFGLDASADPFLLSRGSRQLLALVSIAVSAPRVVVLDEPTTGLDYRECEKIMQCVRRLHENGTTVVMVCHDMEVVADFADRVIVMTAGCVVADGPVFEVMRDEEVLAKASIEPSQMTALSMLLGKGLSGGLRERVLSSNTLEELSIVLGDALAGGASASSGMHGLLPGRAAGGKGRVRTEGELR